MGWAQGWHHAANSASGNRARASASDPLGGGTEGRRGSTVGYGTNNGTGKMDGGRGGVVGGGTAGKGGSGATGGPRYCQA